MKRWSLLLLMLAMTALLLVTVALFSPYAPVVEPVRGIEEIWAIEDARRESGTPLVTQLANYGMPLGYDEAENTFYCPIGLGLGETWPDLHLTAPDAQNVKLLFVDDYSYDWCEDAVRDGYPYQIIAYTDTQFSYAQIVFTGLPIICLQTEGTMDYETDTAAQVTISSQDGGLTARALTHLRGAGSRMSEKKNYKISFVHGQKDSGAIVNVPGMRQADDVILLSGVMDSSLMRDRLSWDVYGRIAGENEPYGPRRTQYVELFVNDRYQGAYVMMEPVDDGEELAKRSANAPMTDSVYRTAQIDYAGERAYVDNPMREGSIYELYHAPSAGHAFDALAQYLAAEQMDAADDDAFERLVTAHIDMESILRYYLFVQAGGMSDNVFNNMYVIAQQEGGKLTYRFAPWDMDLTWGRYKDSSGEDFYHELFSFPVVERMLAIDAGGTARETLLALWADLRERVFNEETIQALVDGYTYELDASGAYMRDAQRWRGEAYLADGYEIISFAAEHLPILDDIFAGYASD